MAPHGKLAFFITGTVFATESSQGFRRFHLQRGDVQIRVLFVENYEAVAPFDDVSNYPALLVVQRDHPTEYPVRYRVWRSLASERERISGYEDGMAFRQQTPFQDLWAAPVPGTDAGPWLIGSASEHRLWQRVFAAAEPQYRARKGITTDRNGIYFVRVLSVSAGGKSCTIQNEPALGRKSAIPQVTAVVECEHVYPLLRGRGVQAFSATPDPDYRVLLPQRGMYGDADLSQTAPGAFRFLNRFRDELEQRSSLRRFQKGQPFWSVWTTGRIPSALTRCCGRRCLAGALLPRISAAMKTHCWARDWSSPTISFTSCPSKKRMRLPFSPAFSTRR